MNNNEPVSKESVQDEALDVLTLMLYRLYVESVVNHGHTDHAA